MRIKLLTYNIQSWDMNDRRKLGVVDLIKRHNPDVICLQEVTVKWFSLLRKELSDIYAFCGRDRFHGNKEIIEWKKERNCVLYKKDKFMASYSHTYWYNDDITKPGMTEEAEYNRVFTCVGLKEKNSGKNFELISTHLEYTTAHCRELQAEILVNYLKKQNKTIVLAGDFNSVPEEKAYQLVSKEMTDIGKEFSITENTYHSYKREAPTRIDFIFRTNDVKPLSFDVIKDEFDGLPPSDHYPLKCTFEL